MTKEQEVIKYIETRIKICNENADICDDNDFDEEATYLREESYMLETVLNMLKEKDKEKDKEIEKALEIAFQYGQIDGDHHKTWVIDQMVRTLTGDKYNEFVKEYETDEETGEKEWSWKNGIAP